MVLVFDVIIRTRTEGKHRQGVLADSKPEDVDGAGVLSDDSGSGSCHCNNDNGTQTEVLSGSGRGGGFYGPH